MELEDAREYRRRSSGNVLARFAILAVASLAPSLVSVGLAYKMREPYTEIIEKDRAINLTLTSMEYSRDTLKNLQEKIEGLSYRPENIVPYLEELRNNKTYYSPLEESIKLVKGDQKKFRDSKEFKEYEKIEDNVSKWSIAGAVLSFLGLFGSMIYGLHGLNKTKRESEEHQYKLERNLSN